MSTPEPVPYPPPSGLFVNWRAALIQLLAWYEARKARARVFYPKLFGVFVGLNMGCYWWALLTAYPDKLKTPEALDILLMCFPVSVLGGVFDFLSLFVTLYCARRALATPNNGVFVAYLSVDFVIAVAATAWVLFVFTVSGWLVNLILSSPETLIQREQLYKGRFWAALMDPLHPESIRNIYFGIVMGASAMLPTLIHLYHATRSGFGALRATSAGRA